MEYLGKEGIEQLSAIKTVHEMFRALIPGSTFYMAHMPRLVMKMVSNVAAGGRLCLREGSGEQR
jgi:hypothetical protein